MCPPSRASAIDEKRIVSSTAPLSLGKVPQRPAGRGRRRDRPRARLGVAGGSGAEVTVVEFLDRIPARIDTEVARQFQRMLEKQGIGFKLASKVAAIDSTGAVLKASVEPAAGGAAQKIEADVR